MLAAPWCSLVSLASLKLRIFHRDHLALIVRQVYFWTIFSARHSRDTSSPLAHCPTNRSPIHRLFALPNQMTCHVTRQCFYVMNSAIRLKQHAYSTTFVRIGLYRWAFDNRRTLYATDSFQCSFALLFFHCQYIAAASPTHSALALLFVSPHHPPISSRPRQVLAGEHSRSFAAVYFMKFSFRMGFLIYFYNQPIASCLSDHRSLPLTYFPSFISTQQFWYYKSTASNRLLAFFLNLSVSTFLTCLISLYVYLRRALIWSVIVITAAEDIRHRVKHVFLGILHLSRYLHICERCQQSALSYKATISLATRITWVHS